MLSYCESELSVAVHHAHCCCVVRRAPQCSCIARLTGWTMGRCPLHRWVCPGWIRGKWVSPSVWSGCSIPSLGLLVSCPLLVLTFNSPFGCPGLSALTHSPLCSYLTLSPSDSHTPGPYPVVKQEQLSPRCSSSQAENLSTQGAPHDANAGRGEFTAR